MKEKTRNRIFRSIVLSFVCVFMLLSHATMKVDASSQSDPPPEPDTVFKYVLVYPDGSEEEFDDYDEAKAKEDVYKVLVEEAETDKNGQIILKNWMINGDIIIEEIEAPEGYIFDKETNNKEVKIEKDGSVKFENTKTKIKNTVAKGNDKTGTITIKKGEEVTVTDLVELDGLDKEATYMLVSYLYKSNEQVSSQETQISGKDTSVTVTFNEKLKEAGEYNIKNELILDDKVLYEHNKDLNDPNEKIIIEIKEEIKQEVKKLPIPKTGINNNFLNVLFSKINIFTTRYNSFQQQEITFEKEETRTNFTINKVDEEDKPLKGAKFRILGKPKIEKRLKVTIRKFVEYVFNGAENEIRYNTFNIVVECPDGKKHEFTLGNEESKTLYLSVDKTYCISETVPTQEEVEGVFTQSTHVYLSYLKPTAFNISEEGIITYNVPSWGQLRVLPTYQTQNIDSRSNVYFGKFGPEIIIGNEVNCGVK